MDMEFLGNLYSDSIAPIKILIWSLDFQCSSDFLNLIVLFCFLFFLGKLTFCQLLSLC